MSTHPVQALDPVFSFLDGMIEDFGLYLFMGFAYSVIPLLVWVLCGGLRRKLLKGEQLPHVPPVIVIHIPIGRPTPPPEPFNLFSPLCEPPNDDPDDG